MKDAQEGREVAKDPQTAYREAHEFAITTIAELIRQVEEDGTPYEQVRPLIQEALASVPPNPTPPTEEQIAEAHRLISDVLAARP